MRWISDPGLLASAVCALHTCIWISSKAMGYGSSNGYRSSFQPSDLSQQTSSAEMAKRIKMKPLWHAMMQTVFIGRVSFTDGYPVSARILSPLSALKWGGDHSSIISAPTLEHSVKKKIDFSKILTESCF